MKRFYFITALFLITSLAPVNAVSQGLKGREVLGLRLGGVASPGAVEDCFGRGSELELHFIEGLGSWYGVDIALSMHNFGRSLSREKNIDFTGSDRTVEAEIYSLTFGLVGIRSVTDRISLGMEGGMGLYPITAIIPEGIWEGRVTRNQFGFYTGANIYYSLNRRGLSLDIGAKYHYVFSGDDPWQVLYAYTGEDRLRFIQMTVGIVFYTR
ncbi:MAG: hypothetical protein KAV42_10660 [Candidatus Krumholzibacteria bacterium]|nr:hypothetical protein [Candidatus Krumholzibacteria bacterium]